METWQLFASGFVSRAVRLYTAPVFRTLHNSQDEDFFQHILVCPLNDGTGSVLLAPLTQAAGVQYLVLGEAEQST